MLRGGPLAACLGAGQGGDAGGEVGALRAGGVVVGRGVPGDEVGARAWAGVLRAALWAAA
jgi:hypothetical protein